MRRKWMAVLVVLALLAVGLYFLTRGRAAGGADGETGSVAERLSRERNKRLEKEAQAEPAAVSGSVLRKSDRSAIAGAVVLFTDQRANGAARIKPGQMPEPLSVVTDERGRWQLNVLPGRYAMTASAHGFVPGTQRDVVIRSGVPRSGVEFLLGAGGHALTGVVSDIGGGPIAGVLVSASNLSEGFILRPTRPSFAAITDQNGGYRIDLADGFYDLRTSHADYVSESGNITIKGSAQNVDFRLVPTGAIHGQVLSLVDKKPVSGALVSAKGGQGGARRGFDLSEIFVRGVVSDGDGRFVLKGVRSGVIELRAIAEHFSSGEPTVVEMGIAEQVTDVIVWVDAGFKVSGFVVRDSKEQEGVANVLVGGFNMKQRKPIFASEVSEPDGYFEILGVKPGAYLGFAAGEGVVPNVLGSSFTVKDRDVENVLVVMGRGTTLSGRVEPGTKATLGLEVDVKKLGFANMLSGGAAMLVRGESDASGEFVLTGVPGGEFTLKATVSDGRTGELAITVGSADQDGLLVRLEPRASIAGKVIDDKNRPVAGVEVHVDSAESGGFNFNIGKALAGKTRTAPDGAFKAVGLDPGDYEVWVKDQSGRRGWSDDEHKDEPYRSRTVTVEGVQAVTDVRLVIESAEEEIGGRVLDKQGAPVADAWVIATKLDSDDDADKTDTQGGNDEAGRRSSRMRSRMRRRRGDWGDKEAPVLTDPDGHFVIRRLRKGTYALLANSPKGQGRARATGVATGTHNVTLKLASLGGIGGVLLADGAPVAEYRLQLRGDDWQQKSVNNPDGRFSFERLEPGEYKITAIADAGVTSQETEVHAGAIAELTLTVATWGSIKGKLVSSLTGEPLTGVLYWASSDGGQDNSEVGLKMVSGQGPRTASDGGFLVTKLGAGKGTFRAFGGESIATLQPVAQQEFELKAGETLDIGTVKGIPASDIPEDEKGYIGLFTDVTSYAERPGAVDGEPVPGNLDGNEDYLWVQLVAPSSPAETAGVRVGDRIVSIDGTQVAVVGADTAAVLLGFGRIRNGQIIQLVMDRAGQPAAITITAGPPQDMTP